ncbi:hypothetical protein ACWFRF_17685 [Nocardia sp. NPDC055165]
MTSLTISYRYPNRAWGYSQYHFYEGRDPENFLFGTFFTSFADRRRPTTVGRVVTKVLVKHLPVEGVALHWFSGL